MGSVRTEMIRNVVLVGHSGVGKTTLAEALLVRAGAVARAGRVDDGTSLLDTDPEEQKRHLSLGLSFAPFEWTASDGQRCLVNLIDSPGYPDFVGDVEAALSVADLVVVVVSAVDGVQVQTELLWRRAVERGLSRLVFVNKEDKERADFHGVVEQLRAAFGPAIVPIELPLGEAADLHGVADVLSDDAFDYEPGGDHHRTEMPADVAAEEHRLHESLVEEIVSGDDAQLERYLAGDVPSVADLERTLSREMRDGTEVPVLLGSAVTGVGVDRLADFICELGPAPTANGAGPASAFVFSTISDPFVGQLSVFKVLSGAVAVDDRLVTPAGADERMHTLFRLRGKQQEPLDTVVAGDIAAVAKLASTRTFDVLSARGAGSMGSTGVTLPPPAYGRAVVPRTQADDDKLGTALQRLVADDPSLVVERVVDTQQTVLRGVGDMHVTVALERLTRKFGVNVDTADVRVPYRETIRAAAEAEGKVKKQSGGHGQFAVVTLRVAPLDRGEGFEFVDKIVGGAIPKSFVAAVQRGVEEAMAAGGVHGFPVVDVRVECIDGKFHSVDSSEMAFKTAASQGFKDALTTAGVVVLEPVSLVHVTVPAAMQGEVMNDITTRRGRVQGTDTGTNGDHVVQALVPAAELLAYALDLRSITGGRATFTAQHDHYDVLPANLVDRLPKGT